MKKSLRKRFSQKSRSETSLLYLRTGFTSANFDETLRRQSFFEALFGKKDNLHYPPLEKLEELVEKAVGISSKVEPSSPAYLTT